MTDRRAAHKYRYVGVRLRAGKVLRASPPVRDVPFAEQPKPLYPGCDVVLVLDNEIKLRRSPTLHPATLFALALEHSRHGPRSVHIMGATPELRIAVASVVGSAFQGVELTIAATAGQRLRYLPARGQTVRVTHPVADDKTARTADLRLSAAKGGRGIVADLHPPGAVPVGCDLRIYLDLDPLTASLEELGLTYALALSHCQSDPRSVRIIGGPRRFRRAVGMVLATAFRGLDVAIVSDRGHARPAVPLGTAEAVDTRLASAESDRE